MTTTATAPMKWARVTRHQGSMEHCACCGRKITGKPMLVEVIEGGSLVAAPGLGADENDPGYMGFFPVGETCAARNFPGFARRMD